jgi:hypothetical protein
MVDSTAQGKEPLTAKSLWKHILWPMLLGALLAILFFHYVPNMMGLLWDDTGFKDAGDLAMQKTIEPFKALMTGESEDVGILGWPLLGAIIGYYVFKIARH